MHTFQTAVVRQTQKKSTKTLCCHLMEEIESKITSQCISDGEVTALTRPQVIDTQVRYSNLTLVT